MQPFIIHYYEGQAVGLSVQAGEEEWSINMKRGLVSLLQLDLLRLQSPAFISAEVYYLHKPIKLFKAGVKNTWPVFCMRPIGSLCATLRLIVL